MKNYYLPLHPAPWTGQEKNLLSFLSAERIEKIKKYHFTEDQKLSFYAALLVRMALITNMQIPNHLLQFSYDTHKKPFLLNSPECFFNFSHTRNAVLCSVSKTAPVGADIEYIKGTPFEIGDMIFHPAEKEYLLTSGSLKEKQQRFFKIWTRKEAFTKCLGTGITDNLSSINTLSPLTESNFYTTKTEEYILSLYSSELVSSIELISESQLINYWQNLM